MSARWSLRVRRQEVAVAVGLALGVLGVGAVPSGAAGGPQAAAAVAVAHRAAGLTAAGSEVVADRTEMSRTYRQEDGSMVTRVGMQPLNVRDAQGHWQPVDTTLRAVQDALVPVATAGDLSIPQRSGEAVSLGDEDASVAFKLQSDTSEVTAQSQGSTATFDDVLPGVDAHYVAQNAGVKETLLLEDASAPAQYRYDLKANGVRAQLAGDGSIRFKTTAGETTFVMPAPTVQAANQAVPVGEPVHYTLSDDEQTLTVSVDPAWLAGATFPVKLDPSLYDGDQMGCTLSSGALDSTSDCGAATLRVGNDGASEQRAAIRFNAMARLPIPRSAMIHYAQLGVVFDGMSNQADSPTLLISGLGNRLDSGATWNTYDGANSWETAGGDIAASPQLVPRRSGSYFNHYDGEVLGFDVSPLVEGWIRDPSTNNGVLLRAGSPQTTNVMTLEGPTSSTGNPYLYIEWSARSGAERDGTYEQLGIDDRSGLSVNVASGNLSVQNDDIRLPGVAGLDLDVARTYNSTDIGRSSELGSGWTTSVNGAGLILDDNYLGFGKVLHTNGGAIYRFDHDEAKTVYKTGSSTDVATYAFTTPSGIDATMTQQAWNGTDAPTTVTFPKTGITWTYSGGRWDGSIARQTLTQIADAHGNNITLTYSAADPLVLQSVTDSYGNQLAVQRDADGNISNLTDSTGRNWAYALDSANAKRLVSATNPDHKTTAYAYDTTDAAVPDRLTQITDARGKPIRIAYDWADGYHDRVSSITRPLDANPANDVVWRFNYDPDAGTGHSCSDTSNDRTVETDPRGKQTTYCVNQSGQVVETWDALGRKATQGYNAQGNVTNVTASTSGTGKAFQLNYASNSTHNFTDAIEPAGATFSAQYCMTPGSSTNACTGGVSGMMAQYKQSQSTDQQGTKTNYDYNATGDLSTVRDNASPTVAKLVLAYNTDGTIKTSTDANGRVTTYSYTGHNLTTITPPVTTGGVTQLGATTLTYDPLNRLKTVRDGRGTTTTLTYDGEDRVTYTSYSSGTPFSLSYDANGNITQRVSGTNTSTYAYDALNRRTSELFPGSRSNGYTYDKTGNLLSVSDAAGTTTYAYDDLNRLQSVTSPKIGTANCTTAPTSCNAVSYAYSDSPGISGASNSQTATFPGGVKQVLAQNASGRQISNSIRNSSGTVLKSFAYSYTQSSVQRALVQSVTEQPANQMSTYTYNTSAGTPRLSTATTTKAGATTDAYSYLFDPAGNRIRATRTTGGTTTTTTYAYNQANQMCWQVATISTATCAGTAPSGATTYAYDAAGNRTTGAAFDTLNRLTTLGGQTLSYLTPDNSELVGMGTTGYLNNLLGLSRELTSSSETDYTRQPDGTPVAQRSTTSKQYLLADRLGSTVALADDNSNALTRTYAYDPYGQRTTTTTGTGSGAATNLGYAAGHTLPTGDVHYAARYYNPALGIWSQQDPLQQIISLQQANRYAYVGGDPINGIDPTGLSIFSDIGDAFRGCAKGGAVGATGGALGGAAVGAAGLGAGAGPGAAAGGLAGLVGGCFTGAYAEQDKDN